MVFIAYCAGNAAGPSFVYDGEAPGYKTAAVAMLGGYLGKTICHCALGFYVSVARDRLIQWNEDADNSR